MNNSLQTDKWDWPGARWWKCDLHVHTPGSDDFKHEATAQEWVQAALTNGLDVVAVSDHNTARWVDQIRQAAEGTDLAIFPAVELTVHGGTHLLALFPRFADSNTIERFLGACGQPDPGNREAASRCSFLQALEKSKSYDSVLIAAHITTDRGLFVQLDFGDSLQQILRSDDLDAVEINGWNSHVPSEHKDKLQGALSGELPDYRRARGPLAILRSSDAHALSEIGRGFTWIKMTRPSLEGIRLALQDGQPLSVRNEWAGGTDDPNVHADSVIECIEVSGFKYMGQDRPLSVPFNPWLNTIIGGRGTGKSTLVEALRLALRRWDELPPSLAKDLDHYRRVSKARGDDGLLTPDAQVLVYYRKDGARFRLRWREDGEDAAIEKLQPGGTWERSPGDVAQRFPARIYSQKQIFQLSSDPSALLKIIDEAPEVDYREWEQERGRLEARYLSLRAKARELEEDLHQEQTVRGELDDVRRKLDVFESGGHTELLREVQRRRGQSRDIDRWRDEAVGLGDRLRSAAEELVVSLPDSERWAEGAEKDELFDVLNRAKASLDQIRERVEELASTADRAIRDASQAIEASQWTRAKVETERNYQELLAALDAQGIDDPRQYGQLVQRRHVLEEKLQGLDDLREQVADIRREAADQLEELTRHRKEITRRRHDFLGRILEGSETIHAHVVPCGNHSTVEAEIRELLERSGTRTFESDLGRPGKGGLLGDLYESYPPRSKNENGSDELFATFDGRLREFKRDLAAFAKGEDHDRARHVTFARHLQLLPPERLDRLKLWFPADSLEVSYSTSGDGRKLKPISQGSPGQKTAALLALLLAYGDEPIILDQPEDDLDNHLIYDLVVQRIREIKTDRQVLIVTHNPNIVVHGDAELVIPLEVHKGQTRVVHTGGLQEQEVRDEVCRVMEGGREALRRRYHRIGHGSGDRQQDQAS